MAVLNRNAHTYRTYIKRVRKTPAGVVFGAAAAAPTVIGIVLNSCVVSLLGIAFEIFFLIDYAVAIANLVIVTGKPLVQCPSSEAVFFAGKLIGILYKKDRLLLLKIINIIKS